MRHVYMRNVLIVCLACAIGSSAAVAAPTSHAKRTATAQGIKPGAHSRGHRQARGGQDLGGIHPLVGSGAY